MYEFIPRSRRAAPPVRNHPSIPFMRWKLNRLARHGLNVNLIALVKTVCRVWHLPYPNAELKTCPDG